MSVPKSYLVEVAPITKSPFATNLFYFSTEKIAEIQDIYRTLFVKGYNTAKSIKIIETEFSPTTERDEILQFIKESDRGIMKGYIAK